MSEQPVTRPIHRLCAYLSLHGSSMIETGAQIDFCNRFDQKQMVPFHVQEVREKLEALLQAVDAYEKDLEASVEIVPPPNVIPMRDFAPATERV